MNIPLKLKKKQLDTLIEILQEQPIRRPQKIADKCMFYLYTSVLKKLLKKQIAKSDDFTNKPFKISLKYEEATALYLEIDKVIIVNGEYKANLVMATISTLHQKLN